MITGFYTGVFAFILAGLVVRIARKRMRYRVGIGDGGISDLAQAVRVHGNFTETVPMLLIVLLLMEQNGAAPIILHIFGSFAVLSRGLHIYGLSSTPLASKGRFTGTVLTMFLLITGGLFLIVKAL